MEDIEILDDKIIEPERKNEKKGKKIIKIIFLIITFLMLLSSIGISIYFMRRNEDVDKDLTSLKDNITKVKDKINGYDSQKEEKQTEYEKLEKEMKEKIEELNVWKELKEKIETALQ